MSTDRNITMESPAEKSYARHQAKLAKIAKHAMPAKREATPADLGILQASKDRWVYASDDHQLTYLEDMCDVLGIDRSHAYDVVFG